MFPFAARTIQRSRDASWVEGFSDDGSNSEEENEDRDASTNECSSDSDDDDDDDDDDLSTIQPRTIMSSSMSSIGYNEAVVGVPPGTFVEIYRDQMTLFEQQQQQQQQQQQTDADCDNSSFHERQTIVSSSPSETDALAFIPRVPPFPRNNLEIVLAMNPPSQVLTQNPLSISTTETLYQDLSSLEGSRAPLPNEAGGPNPPLNDTSSFLSLRPSMMDSSFIHGSSNYCFDDNSVASGSDETTEPTETVHDSNAFSNVGNRLASVPEGSPSSAQHHGQWFSTFSERDWVRFHNEADMVLSAMVEEEQETNENYVPPLPPQPPKLKRTAVATRRQRGSAGRRPYIAHNHLPSTFLCSLCDDVLVGAATMDCGCPNSTVCYSCWEGQRTSTEDDEELDDCVCVENSSTCPFCEKPVTKVIGCHALDVAILHCVRALPEDLPIQNAYYQRLRGWRSEILRRRKELKYKNDHQIEKDRMLAELIHREEQVLWQKQKQRQKQGWWQSDGVVRATQLVALVAGTVLFLRFRVVG